MLARAAGVRAVSQKGNLLEVLFSPKVRLGQEVIRRWLKTYAGRLRFTPRPEGDGVEVDIQDVQPLAWLEVFLGGL